MIWTGIFRWAMWLMGLLFKYFILLASLHNYSFFRCFWKPICSSSWCSVSIQHIDDDFIQVATSVWHQHGLPFPDNLRDWTTDRHLYIFLKDYTKLFTWIAYVNCQWNFDEQFMLCTNGIPLHILAFLA